MTIKIGALLPFHNEISYLPGWFESIGRHVDAVVALDDRSTDGSYDYVASRQEISSILRINAADGKSWDEPLNRQLLVMEGQRLNCDWFVAFDADERVEERFWQVARQIAADAEKRGMHAFQFRLRELWDSVRQYRVDGLWGRKLKAAFFSNLGSKHIFDRAQWHGEWISTNPIHAACSEKLPLNLYHLRMVKDTDRIARRDRYNKLDPDKKFQSIGYDYLTDKTAIELAPILSEEMYQGIPEHLAHLF